MTQQVISNSPVVFSTNQSFLIALLAAVIVHIVLVIGVQVPKPEVRKNNRDIDITLVDTLTTKAPEQTEFLAPQNQLAQAIQPEPIKPVPSPKQAMPEIKPAPKPPVEKPKPIAEKKPIIKTPPEPPKVAPQEKRIIKTPPEQVKPKIEEKRIIKTPPEQLKPEPVKKQLEPIKELNDVKPVITTPEKTKPLLQEQQIPKDLFQATGKPEEHVEPKKSEKPDTESQSKDAKLENHPHISATALQQQIAEQVVQATQRPASETETKTKRVNQVSAHKSVAAQYKRDWETKVERVGNLNYPEAATKPGFSATLTMDVGIKADGSIDSMRITQSSGIPELDEAAKKIVEMSAPFPPLPDALRSELDILLITRVWKFTDESGLITQ